MSSTTTKKGKLSSKTAPPPSVEKNKKTTSNVSASSTLNSAPTSPWVERSGREIDPALPWAGDQRAHAQVQFESHEPGIGSPCPISQRHSPSLAPRVSRVPQAQFVANTGTGFSSPWVAPAPPGNVAAGTAQHQQWNFPADA